MHAKSKISGMLPKSFKAGKCKTSLKLAMARIKLLKNKREVLLKQMRRDLAQLLESGQEQTARIRVEHVIREEKTMSAYDLIEIYCELIVARLSIIESQKSCPIDLKEAVASIVFASPRCADIPELMEIRKHFLAKYGKEFITAALEVRPECGVSRMVVEKLSARAPDVETKLKTLTAIAQDHNVTWDPEAFQEQIKKPDDDLLNGPTSFPRASKMTMQSSSVTDQVNVSIREMPENVVTSKPNNFNTLSHESINTSSSSVPIASQSTPKASENRSGGEELKFSYSKEDGALSQSNWNMEFRDATSAAQAAAESAERASIAARAAAELASRGNVSRQNSSVSQESTVHGIRAVPGTSKGSRPEGEHPVRESVRMEENEGKAFQGMKFKMHKPQVVEASTMRDTEYDGHGTVGNISLSRSPSHSSTSSINDDVSEFNLQKADSEAYNFTPKWFSEAEYAVQHQNNEKVEHADVGSGNVNESKSASSQLSNAFDGDIIWDNAERNTTIGDYGGAVFDDYGSDTDGHSALGMGNRGNLLDSFMLQQSSSFSSNMEPWSPGQQKGKSLVTDARSPFVTEPHATEYSETITKGTLPSQSDNIPAAYDSDGLSSKDDYEIDQSTKGPLPAGSTHETTNFEGKKGVEGAKTNSPSSYSDINEKTHEAELISSNRYGKSSGFSGQVNQPSPRYDERNPDDSMKGSDISLREKEPWSWRSPRVSSMDEAETMDQISMPSSPPGIKDSEISDDSYESGQGLNLGRLTGGFKNRGYHRPPYVRTPLVGASLPSKQASDDSPSIIEKSVVSDVDDSLASTEVPVQRQHRKGYKESSLRSPGTNLNLGSNEQEHHTVRSGHHTDISSTQTEGPDISPINEKSTVSHSGKTLSSPEIQKQHSGMPMNYYDLDNHDEEDLMSRHTVGKRGNIDAKLSRRTREIPSVGKKGSLSRTINPSEMPTVSDMENMASQSSFYATESFSNKRTHARNLDWKESSKSLQPNSSAEHSLVTPLKTESSTLTQSLVPDNGANSKTYSSSRESSSHGSSRKNASHVHPKLPDYDSIMAHFQSLRSNRA
ncbi:sericin 1 [Cocos nucifera]|uniref:Sericin 1 n=1 Tax=Cocos nucifera TaxID=13894 RepID=A0A8K0IAP1_COCNU|nr:sericin 1 [Cocos nucifera]